MRFQKFEEKNRQQAISCVENGTVQLQSDVIRSTHTVTATNLYRKYSVEQKSTEK